ncbi:MAG TPA: hypothetical protein VE908_05690 [Mycobacterium sp.]|nr:hypothetical protein [Mycobacterium sp.]
MTDPIASQSMAPAPFFSIWSPVVAVVGAVVAYSAPGWLVAVVWALVVLCALPFKRFRAVVPVALLTWSAGWLAALLLSFAEAGIVGLFVVK